MFNIKRDPLFMRLVNKSSVLMCFVELTLETLVLSALLIMVVTNRAGSCTTFVPLVNIFHIGEKASVVQRSGLYQPLQNCQPDPMGFGICCHALTVYAPAEISVSI